MEAAPHHRRFGSHEGTGVAQTPRHHRFPSGSHQVCLEVQLDRLMAQGLCRVLWWLVSTILHSADQYHDMVIPV